jgi:hypothetical protein
MEFITVEQFKEQPEEVQEVFLDWYNFDKYDLFYLKWEGAEKKWGATEEIVSGATLNRHLKHLKRANSNIINTIPLFTEGQLRKFIEDKLNIKAQFSIHFLTLNYVMITDEDSDKVWVHTGTNDLLQAYWKVACDVAKEEVDE